MKEKKVGETFRSKKVEFSEKCSNSIFRAGKAVVATLTSSVRRCPGKYMGDISICMKEGQTRCRCGCLALLSIAFRLLHESRVTIPCQLGLEPRVQTLTQRERNEKRLRSRITRYVYLSVRIFRTRSWVELDSMCLSPHNFLSYLFTFFFSRERESYAVINQRKSIYIYEEDRSEKILSRETFVILARIYIYIQVTRVSLFNIFLLSIRRILLLEMELIFSKKFSLPLPSSSSFRLSLEERRMRAEI